MWERISLFSILWNCDSSSRIPQFSHFIFEQNYINSIFYNQILVDLPSIGTRVEHLVWFFNKKVCHLVQFLRIPTQMYVPWYLFRLRLIGNIEWETLLWIVSTANCSSSENSASNVMRLTSSISLRNVVFSYGRIYLSRLYLFGWRYIIIIN